MASQEDERLTGRRLNEEWNVGARHALYRQDGSWYHQLVDFPGALFDEYGYVLFESEEAFRNCANLRILKDVHVPDGISTIPGYISRGTKSGRSEPDLGEVIGASGSSPVDQVNDDDESLDGTEYEDTGISKPFDPTLINILSKQMSLDTLLKRMREGEVDLSPDFQRGEVWKSTARSRLIESLLIRIPLPAFYMDATNEDRWLVVDGLQRLSTLRDFSINKTMRLKDLEFLTQFTGAKYEDLPRNYQRRIEETQVTVYLIEKGTPPEVKFNIFKRINTGGLPLSAQEIRHALNQGPVTSYLRVLAESEEFCRATDRSISDKRMMARECVLRFLAFRITPPEEYRATDFDAFLSEAMSRLNEMSDTETEALAGRFLRALRACNAIWGTYAFRKPTRKNRLPVNKALFEVWTVTMDQQSDWKIAELEESYERVIQQTNNLMLHDAEFIDSISQSTGDPAKVRFRFDRFKRLLEESAR